MSVAVMRQQARDRRIDTALIAGGVLVGLGVLYLVSDSKEELLANEWPNLWELQDPDALSVATRRGLVYPSEVQRVIDGGRIPVLVNLIRWLGEDAQGTLNDREDLVMAACMRPTYAELLLFTGMFSERYAISPGAYISTFMDPGSDAAPLAAIVAHVYRLRDRQAAEHG